MSNSQVERTQIDKDDSYMQNGGKVFGIGLSKTGTTSLAFALSRMGFATKHLPLAGRDFCRFEAFSDSSVAVRFQRLDKRFPGSKFIYTVREEESWIQSCREHFAALTNRRDWEIIRLQLFGCRQFDEELFRAAYRWHDVKVRRYFRYRPSSLLIINIADEGDSCWDRLCAFLGREKPNTPFPWKNKQRVLPQSAP